MNEPSADRLIRVGKNSWIRASRIESIERSFKPNYTATGFCEVEVRTFSGQAHYWTATHDEIQNLIAQASG